MTSHDTAAIDVADLRSRFAAGRQGYATATPFPHVVLDEFAPAGVYSRALAEFPSADDPSWQRYAHVNERKFANRDPTSWGPALRELVADLTGSEFTGLLAELTGIEGLEADPTMDGGGLHQTLAGGFLNVHTDFSAHHTRRNWKRRVNLIYYLNEDWPTEWGGALELWDRDVRRCVDRIDPVGNRAVIFSTLEGSYHGHPDPLACPPDNARRSLALYYFTAEDRVSRRATRYRSRPGDGAKALGIWADRQVVAVYDKVKATRGSGDELASGRLARAYQRLTGSAERNQPPIDVQSFFDRQHTEDRYAALKAATRQLDQAAADRLNDLIRGDVLAVGGVWDFFEPTERVGHLTVLDLSIETLNTYCPAGATEIHGDMYTVELPEQSFDTVVFPLMLHHTPVGRWSRNEQRIDEALARAAGWLRDDGQVIILEYCPHPAWQPVQRGLLPITRRFLARFGQPLVVMYTRRFYEAALAKRFTDVDQERVAPDGFDYWVWYPVFMGVPWLRIPLALYPKMHVIVGRRATRRSR